MGNNKRKAESGKRKAGFVIYALCFLLLSCSDRPKKHDSTSTTKFKQYYNQGELLYEKNCSNCHQKNGTGLGRLYPPLEKSDYMKNNFDAVICLMRNGIMGELKV